MSEPTPDRAAGAAPTDPSGAAGLPDATGEPKEKAKPKGLIRWLVLLVVLIVPPIVAFVIKDTVAYAVAKQVGAKAVGAPVDIESAQVDLLKGIVTLNKVVAHDPKAEEDELFSAEVVVADINILQSLRGQVVIDELRVTRPKGKVVRRKDGTIGLGEGPSEPPGTVEGEGGEKVERPPETSDEAWRRKVEEMAKKRDFMGDLKQVVEKVREYASRRGEEQKERDARKTGDEQDPSGRAQYIREDRPMVVVKKLVCDEVEIEVRNEVDDSPPLHLEKTQLTLENLTSDPFVYADPIKLNLQGQIAEAAGSLLKITGGLDMSYESLKSLLDLEAKELPLDLLDPLIRDTLPIRFKKGTKLSADMPLSFDDFDIDWKPILALADIDVDLRDPSQQKIAGLDAAKLVAALQEVQSITLEDLHVFGPLEHPDVEFGDTLQQLVIQGGKAFAERKAREKAAELQGKLEGQLSEQTGKLREKLGDDNPASELIDAGEGLIKGSTSDGAGDAVEKAKGAFEGLFGGSEKKKDP